MNNALGKLYAQGGTNRINNVSDKRNIRSVAHCSAVGAVKREQRNNCADDPMHSPEEPEFSEKDSEYQRGHKRDNVKKDNLNTRTNEFFSMKISTTAQTNVTSARKPQKPFKMPNTAVKR